MSRAAILALAALLALAGTAGARASGVATQRISGKTIATLAQRAVSGIPRSGDSELIAAFPVPDQIVQAGTPSLVAGTPLVSASYVNVPVEVDVDGRFSRTIFVGYRVQPYVITAVAARDVVPGTVLGENDLRIARVPFTGQRTNGIDALVGRKVSSAIRAGAPVYIEMTQTDEIVRAGNTVVLIVHDGGVTIAADVLARTGGGLGDHVSLYNPQTNKAMSGVVVGPDRVELDLTGDTP